MRGGKLKIKKKERKKKHFESGMTGVKSLPERDLLEQRKFTGIYWDLL
jgi:hypothetical protein